MKMIEGKGTHLSIPWIMMGIAYRETERCYMLAVHKDSLYLFNIKTLYWLINICIAK